MFIIRLVNGTNRRISLFFDSLRNNDSSLHFEEKTHDPFLEKMNKEMNRITSMLSESRVEVEEKRLYYESILRVLTHEIRNSITPIASLSADLLEYSDSYAQEQLKEGLEVINSQARNLTAFLNSYHRLTHLPDPELQKVSIKPLFQKLHRLLLAEPGSQYVQYQSPEDLSVKADPNLLVLALINLIRNAMQAMAGRENGEIIVKAFLSKGHIHITITDNGPGIPKEQLSAIFIPFYSTKEGGSGIGIPLSYRIMQMHGGELTVSSEVNVQTIFTLHF